MLRTPAPLIGALDFNMRAPNLKSFLKRHGIRADRGTADIELAVDVLMQVHEISYEALSQIDSKTNRDGWVVQAHINQLGRLFEQASGMLVCVCARAFESVEALARVVLEGAINLIYLSTNEHDSTLVAYIDAWITEHERKLGEWKAHLELDATFPDVQKMIDERHRYITTQRRLLDQFVEQFDIKRGSIREH